MIIAPPFSVTKKGNSLSDSYPVNLRFKESFLEGGSYEVNSGKVLIKLNSKNLK